MANASRCTVGSIGLAVVVVLAASSAEAQFVQCGATPSACRSAGHGTLVYTDRSNDADDLLKLRMKHVESTQADEFADPTTSADYRFCLFANGTLVSQAILPAALSAQNWESNRGGFHYGDKSGSRGGVTSIQLQKGDRDNATVLLHGKGLNLYEVLLPLAGPVIAELHNGSNGDCWSVGFAPDEIRINDRTKGKFGARH